MTTTPTDSDESPDDYQPYFGETGFRLEMIESTRNRLNKVQASLEALDNDLKQIDCDHGAASLEINGETITVEMATPVLNSAIRTVLDTHNWTSINAEYIPDTGNLNWSLKTTLDELIQ